MTALGTDDLGVSTGSAPDLLALLDVAATRSLRLRFVADGQEVPFAQLWRDAHRTAAWVQQELPDDEALAVLLEPTAASLTVVLGSWLAGRMVASLPGRARGMTVDEHVRQCSELAALAGATATIAPAPVVDRFPGRVLRTTDIGRAPGSGGADGLGATLVQFTSGSTARPAGVVLTTTDLGTNVVAIGDALDLRRDDVFTSWLPLSHDLGLVGMCLAPLASGARCLRSDALVVLDSPDRFRRRPASWLELAAEVGATVTMGPTTAVSLAARALGRSDRHHDLTSLRCLVVGAEPVTTEALQALGRAGAAHGLRPTALCPAYGLAEATLAVTTTRPHEHWHARARALRADQVGPADLVALGRPVDGVRVRIGPSGQHGPDGDDSDAGSDGAGAIEVRGPSVADVHLGRPSPVGADGWLRTGDLGLLVDGELHVVGRAADVLLVGGRTVDGEYLQRRLGQVDGVRPGCCVVFHDGASSYVVAYEPDARLPPDQAGDLCRTIAGSAVEICGGAPGRVVAVGRGTLPKTPSGKLRPAQARAGLDDGTIDVVAEARTRRRRT